MSLKAQFYLHHNGILKPSIGQLYCPGQTGPVPLLWGQALPDYLVLCPSPRTARIAHNQNKSGNDKEEKMLQDFLKYFNIKPIFMEAKCGGRIHKEMDGATSLVTFF